MRHAWKIVVAVLVVVIALPLMGVAAAIVTFNTPQGRFVIETLTEWLTHGNVRLQGLAGRFPDRLRLAHLTIADPKGAWLTADDLALDWSPQQLIEGRARIERATATRIEVLRRPNYPAKPPRAARREPFTLPFTVQLQQLTLPRVELSAAIAGNATVVRVEGQGRFRSLEQASLQLTAERLDQVPSVYGLSLQSGPARIQARLDLQENADGPLANLIGLPGLGALAVHLDLLGPSDALATTFDGRAGPLRAQATGTLDLPALSANLSLTLDSPAMTPRPGLSWQHIALHAQSQGAFIAPTTSGKLELTGLTLGSLQLESLVADLRGEGRGLALEATLVGLTLPGPIHSLLARAPIHLQGQAEMVSANGFDFDLALSHPLLQAKAHYELGDAGSALQASVPGRAKSAPAAVRRNGGTLIATVPALAPWAQLVQLKLDGRGSIQAGVSVLPQAVRVTMAAGLDLRDGDTRWTKLVGPHAQIGAAVLIRPNDLQLERAELTGSNLQASAHGDDRNQKLDIAWQMALSNLSGLSSAVAGPLSVQGRVQGSMPRLTVAAQASGELSHRSARAALSATLHVTDLPQHPSGRLEVSGSLNDAPLALTVSLQAAAPNQATLTLERVDWKSVHAEGALQVDGDLLAPQGQLSLRLTHLQDLDTLIGAPLQGGVEARIAIERSGGQSRARVALNAQDVSLPAGRLTALQLRGDIDDALRHPHFALQLSSKALVHGIAAELSARADGPLDALTLHASGSTNTPPGSASPTAAAGSSSAGATAADSSFMLQAVWNQQQRQLKLTELQARYREQGARLLEPALISLRDGITVDRLRLQLPPAVIQLQGRLTPTLQLRASVRNFNPGAFGVVMPLVQAQGRTDIDVELHGELTHPTGTVTLTAGGLSATSGAARGLPPAALKVTAQLADGSADVNATLSAGTQMQLRATGRVPLLRSGAIAVKLTGGMELGLLNPVLEARGQRLLGQLNVEAQFSGTAAAPQARGSLTISHGELQDYPRGFHLTELSVALDAEGSQLLLKQFSAHAGPGTLSATGNLNLSAPGMPVQLQFTAQNAEPLKSDLLTANLNADLHVTGALLRGELAASGTVRVNRATLNIPNALPPDVATLDVRRPGQSSAPPPPKPLVAQLDLTINAPRGVFVRGRGLNAEVGGTVHIGGTPTTPSISGGFDLINGLMDLSGATLTFNSGRVSFNGTGLQHKIDPTLNFVANSAIGGTTATLNITGYVDAPVITLTSTPPEPQDQILAQLLFGENVSQLSALQVAGIASALVKLTGAGGGGGLNPLNTVQRALGLNRLVISSGAPSGATTAAQSSTGVTIQAGRYVSNRIYVGAKQSTNGLTQAQVQVDLTRQLKVQTTLSTGGGTVQGATPENDPGSSVGVSYQFQY